MCAIIIVKQYIYTTHCLSAQLLYNYTTHCLSAQLLYNYTTHCLSAQLLYNYICMLCIIFYLFSTIKIWVNL